MRTSLQFPAPLNMYIDHSFMAPVDVVDIATIDPGQQRNSSRPHTIISVEI